MIDFDDWEDDDDAEVWVTMGANGKHLMGRQCRKRYDGTIAIIRNTIVFEDHAYH